MEFKNENGKTYYINAFYYDLRDGVAYAILEDYGLKTKTELHAGAAPVQYILASFYDIRDWEQRTGSWSCGRYYPGTFDGLKNAKSALQDKIF